MNVILVLVDPKLLVIKEFYNIKNIKQKKRIKIDNL